MTAEQVWSLAGALACAAIVSMAHAQEPVGLPSTLYEEWRKSPLPVNGTVAQSNPPSLQWASVKHWDGRDVLYQVELSDTPNFPADRTQRGPTQRWCFYNLHTKLRPGTWHWRYSVQDGGKRTLQGPYSFEIRADTPVLETTTFDQFLANVPKTHPRVITQGRDLAAIRASAETHPLSKAIVEEGRKAVAAPVYDGPLSDADPARSRTLERMASRDVGLYHRLIDAFVLSGEPAMLDALLKRTDVLLKWPTNDLLGSGVLAAISKAYDALHPQLSPDVRARMLTVIEKQLRKGLAAWPGNIEGRQVENHFWQMELSGNFTAALATVHDLDASREMLEYTYELFLARFPNLATSEGGWAEGLGYFGVNESAVVDMALLLKKVGRVDVFKMPWYRSLADYFIYFAPIGGRIDGFGDMHDRVGNGNIGHAMMLVVGQENQDPRALFRAASLMKGNASVEPWYQIVNGIRFDSATVTSPVALPQDRLFRGVGLAAMHTSVLDRSRDTAVYFRSSPFGAKGHMHANQNAFNLSRRGEPLFYSTGYYTSFADAHSMSSYRHTRAHNAILVNGCGQAFGHEGYGWIKRAASGEKISYVCGDATMAYRPTVDEQFLGLLSECRIPHTREQGHGDGKLKLFERHLLLIRPDTLVVYDVLESAEESDWTLLLHTMKPPVLDPKGSVQLKTEKNRADVCVSGSQPLKASLTDQFFSPPVDMKKKYKEMPNQFHLSYASTGKSKAMRFLTIVRTADAEAEATAVAAAEPGAFTVGGIRIRAEMDCARPASLAAELDSAKLYINAWPAEAFGAAMPPASPDATLLVEKGRERPLNLVLSSNAEPVP